MGAKYITRHTKKGDIKERVSYKAQFIDRLISENPYTSPSEAEFIWQKTYNKVKYQLNKMNSNIKNVAFETYASTFFRGNQLFDVNVNTENLSIDVNKVSTIDDLDYEKSYIYRRFEKLANKYDEAKNILNSYIKDEISYTEFLNQIKKFRDENQEYQKAGSG